MKRIYTVHDFLDYLAITDKPPKQITCGFDGQTQDIKELTDELQKDQDDIIRYITSRTKIDESMLIDAFLSKRDTYYRYDECVKNGIVTDD